MSTMAPIPPITGTVTLGLSAEQAFQVFTGSFDSWWPHEYHIGNADVAEVVLESHEGGRCCCRASPRPSRTSSEQVVMDVMSLARAERADLAELLITPAQWEAPSLCAGWRVRDVVAHVFSYDELGIGGLIGRFVRGGLRPDRVKSIIKTSGVRSACPATSPPSGCALPCSSRSPPPPSAPPNASAG